MCPFNRQKNADDGVNRQPLFLPRTRSVQIGTWYGHRVALNIHTVHTCILKIPPDAPCFFTPRIYRTCWCHGRPKMSPENITSGPVAPVTANIWRIHRSNGRGETRPLPNIWLLCVCAFTKPGPGEWLSMARFKGKVIGKPWLLYVLLPANVEVYLCGLRCLKYRKPQTCSCSKSLIQT